MKLHRWRDVACLMSLVLAVSITPVSAADPQRVERAGRDVNIIESSAGPAIIQTDKGTIIINNIQGIDPEEHRAIAKQLGVTEQALENFFAIVEQQNVPLKDLDAKLREIAEHYKTLLSNVRALSSDDPEVTRLRNEAEMALKAGEFARAEGLLNEASAKDVAAIQALEEQQARLQTARKQRQLSAAKAKAANGDLKNTQLAYVEAAAYYRQAVELLPDDEPLTVARYLNEQGMALYRAGQYAEARPSLEKALAIREKVLGPSTPIPPQASTIWALCSSAGEAGRGPALLRPGPGDSGESARPGASQIPPTSLQQSAACSCLQGPQGKLAEAQPYFARALAIWEKVLGPEHPDTARASTIWLSCIECRGAMPRLSLSISAL